MTVGATADTAAIVIGRRTVSPTSVVLWTIGISLILRAGLAAIMGLSVDEAYIVGMARWPSFGYFDHPPLTMWLIRGLTWLTGSESSFVVRIPALLCFCGTIWFTYLTTARLFSPPAGACAAVALAMAPLFGIYFGTVLVTDGPALLALAIAVDLLTRGLFSTAERVDWRLWIGIGVAFGFAFLSKFTVVLIFPGLLFFILTVPNQRRWLAHPAPYVALVIALALLAPALYWNATHDWATFAFQGERAAFDGQVHALRALRHLVVLALIYIPPIWLALIYGLFRALRLGPTAPRSWFFACLAVLPIAFFPVVWLFGAQSASGFQWAAPGYLVAFPLLGWQAAGWLVSRRPLLRTVTLASLASIAVGYVLYVGDHLIGWVPMLVPQARGNDGVIEDQTDWWSLRDAIVERKLNDPARYFVVAGSWEDCAKVDRVMGERLPLYCLTGNPIGAALAARHDFPLGRDAIVIVNWWPVESALPSLRPYFESIEPMEDVAVQSFGRTILTLKLFHARNLTQPLPATTGFASSGRDPG